MNTADEIRHFIYDNYLFGQADIILSDDTSFLETGTIDSTGLLELISFLEQKLGVRLEDQEITPDNLDSVGKLTAFVERKRAALEQRPISSRLHSECVGAAYDRV